MKGMDFRIHFIIQELEFYFGTVIFLVGGSGEGVGREFFQHLKKLALNMKLDKGVFVNIYLLFLPFLSKISLHMSCLWGKSCLQHATWNFFLHLLWFPMKFCSALWSHFFKFNFCLCLGAFQNQLFNIRKKYFWSNF